MAGLGRETYLKTAKSKKQQIKEVSFKTQEKTFKAAKAEKQLMWTLKKDFQKAQHVCEELDFRNGVTAPVAEYFWTRHGIRQLKQKNKQDEEGSTDEEEYERNITQTNLYKIIDYLRERYLYCMYCVFTASSKSDLDVNCPGPYSLDHDSML